MTNAQSTDAQWAESRRPSIDAAGEPYYRSVISPKDTPSEAVIRTVSTGSGVEPTSLDILHDAIDPDALDAILETRGNPIAVTFQYKGYLVNARNDDGIEIRAD